MSPFSGNNSDLEKILQSLPRFQPSAGFSFKLRCRLAYEQRTTLLQEGFSWLGKTFRVASLVTTAGVFLFASLSSYAFVSSSITPNTPVLGSFERLADGIYVALAGNQDTKTEIQLDLTKKRLEELAAAAQNGTLTAEMITEVSDRSQELLASAKEAPTRLKVETLKGLAEASGQALSTVASAKGAAVSAKASNENLPDEVFQEIRYRALGINLSDEQLVAANQSPSLETSPETALVAKDLYIIHNDPRERQTTPDSLSPSQAGTILQQISQEPEIAVLNQALDELKKQSDLDSLASSVDLPVQVDTVTLE